MEGLALDGNGMSSCMQQGQERCKCTQRSTGLEAEKQKVEVILSIGFFCYHCGINFYSAIEVCSIWRNLGDHYWGGDAPLYHLWFTGTMVRRVWRTLFLNQPHLLIESYFKHVRFNCQIQSFQPSKKWLILSCWQ